MQAKIETKDRATIIKMKPIIRLVRAAVGHLNYSYTHGGEYIQMDQIHKARLCLQIQPLLPSGWDMGTGGGHIWIATPDEGSQEHPIMRRVLLIID